MNRGVIAVLAASAAALALAAAGVAATVVVSRGHLSGWAAMNDTCGGASTGSVGIARMSGIPGGGSARFSVGSNGDSYPTFRTGRYDGVKLSNLTALDYFTFVQQAGAGGQAVYIDLYVDNDLNGTQDDTLTFEPVYNGTVSTGVWQHWNALTGQWWADSSGGPPPLFTLASYIASHPNARIVGAGGFVLAAGCGAGAWTNFIGFADRLTIGVGGRSQTFDFQTGRQGHGNGQGNGQGHDNKILVCHKGNTIGIDRNALPAHMRHGDKIGACDRDKHKEKHHGKGHDKDRHHGDHEDHDD
ncbi:MAG TPA: hypothetical protein VJT84_01420 [Gaiellaceae bacterium]|nr:hypothetical protein [Gaiellaceae bacterium]